MRHLFHATIAATALLIACDSSDGGGNVAADGIDGAGSDTGGDAEDGAGTCYGGAPFELPAPGPDPACPAGRKVDTISGTVIGDGGAALADVKAQACIWATNGGYTCLKPSDTAADGGFSITVPSGYDCLTELVMRVVDPSIASHRSTTYCRVPLDGTGSELTVSEALALQVLAPATELPPEGDDKVARTVSFDGGVTLDVVPDEYFSVDGAYDALSSGWVAADGCVFRGLDGATGAWAFAPEGDIWNDTWAARLPDVQGLGDDVEVDVFVLGAVGCTTADGEIMQEGHWHRFTTVTITDGYLEIPADEGLPCMSWVAYRAAECTP